MARRGSWSGLRVSWRRLVIGAVIAAIVLVFVIGFTQYIPVESRQGLRRAEFGWPLSWLAQDLTIYDPPFPSRVTSTAPQEALTKINWAVFGTDILILSLFELLVLALVLRLGRAKR